MRQGKAFKYSIFAGWIITSLAIFFIASLIIPQESRSSYFWLRVIWTEMLCLLFWGSSAFYIIVSAAQKDSVSRFGGIAPTISIVTAIYAIISFSVMVGHSFVPESDGASRWHLIIQIFVFAVAALLVVFLSISRAAATSGLGFDKTKASTPKELHDLIAARESSLHGSATNELRVGIKKLRESLLYSLNESASLAELPDYQNLCRQIESLCDSIAEPMDSGGNQIDRLTSLKDSAYALMAKIKLISAKQVRR